MNKNPAYLNCTVLCSFLLSRQDNLRFFFQKNFRNFQKFLIF